MKFQKILFALFSSLVFSSLSLSAAAVTFEANENVSFSQESFDDVYIIAANGHVTSNIGGDLHIMGGQVLIDGTVEGDLVVGGGRVTLNGNVNGDVRVIGGQVAIYGNVSEDIVVAGGQVDVGRDSVVEGNVLAGVGVLTIDGIVKKDVRGGMGVLMLNGTVEGNVIITVEDTLNIGQNARINGNLEYSALLETTVPTEAVGGSIIFNKFEENSIAKEITYIFLIQKALSFVSAILLLALLVGVAPRMLMRGGTLSRENVFRSFGLGILAITAAIIGFIVLMFTIVGIPFAVITFSVFLIILYIAKIFTASWIGSYFINYKKPVRKIRLFGVLSLILLAYYVVGLVPFVGWFINIVLFLIGVGTIVFLKYDYMKVMRDKKMI